MKLDRNEFVIPMNIQLLAGEGEPDGAEPTENPVDDNEQEQEAPKAEPPKQEEKTFTQDEVNKLIEKRLARALAKMEADRKESEELAKLSEAERQKKLFEKQVAEFEATKKAFEAEKMLNETMKQLASKNLSTNFAKLLKADDAETTLNNINEFELEFNKAVEARVAERLKGTTPRTSTSKASTELTREQFKKMNIAQKAELLRTNPDLFNKLNL